ncbi:MAG: hypothetical protein EOO65_00040 [Methanosarcinales archaeon]|nr:MAG: hypothetical protein EOO65_00040 [Methanosarcinales archaeon]
MYSRAVLLAAFSFLFSALVVVVSQLRSSSSACPPGHAVRLQKLRMSPRVAHRHWGLHFYIRTFERPEVGYSYLNETVRWYLQKAYHPASHVHLEQLHVGFVTRNATLRGQNATILRSSMPHESDAVLDERHLFASRIPGDYQGPAGFWRAIGQYERQQTEDMNALLAWAFQDCNDAGAEAAASRYVVIMEDDMMPCTQDLLRIMQLMVRNGELLDQPPTALRISMGGNGFMLRCEDMPRVMSYMLANADMGPPDSMLSRLLAVEDAQAKALFGGRLITTFRFHMFKHIGIKRSTGGMYPEEVNCMGSLTGRSMLRDAFDPSCSGLISPCHADRLSSSLLSGE